MTLPATVLRRRLRLCAAGGMTRDECLARAELARAAMAEQWRDLADPALRELAHLTAKFAAARPAMRREILWGMDSIAHTLQVEAASLGIALVAELLRTLRQSLATTPPDAPALPAEVDDHLAALRLVLRRSLDGPPDPALLRLLVQAAVRLRQRDPPRR